MGLVVAEPAAPAAGCETGEAAAAAAAAARGTDATGAAAAAPAAARTALAVSPSGVTWGRGSAAPAASISSPSGAFRFLSPCSAGCASSERKVMTCAGLRACSAMPSPSRRRASCPCGAGPEVSRRKPSSSEARRLRCGGARLLGSGGGPAVVAIDAAPVQLRTRSRGAGEWG